MVRARETHKTGSLNYCWLFFVCVSICSCKMVPSIAVLLLPFVWHERGFSPLSLLNVSCVTMTVVYKWSPFPEPSAPRQMLKHLKCSEGRVWNAVCPGTSIIDITTNFGDILGKTCPAVCEINTWTQCFHQIFFEPPFSGLQKLAVISNMCFSHSLRVKSIDCDCTDKWRLQMCVRPVEHMYILWM